MLHIHKIINNKYLERFINIRYFPYRWYQGPLAQLAERGADNAKAESSSLSRTKFFSFAYTCSYFFPSANKTTALLWKQTFNIMSYFLDGQHS